MEKDGDERAPEKLIKKEMWTTGLDIA